MRVTKRIKRLKRANRVRGLRTSTKRALLGRVRAKNVGPRVGSPLAAGSNALGLKLRAYNQRVAPDAKSSCLGIKRYQLQLTKQNTHEKKHGALRHLQSVRCMLDAERQLLA